MGCAYAYRIPEGRCMSQVKKRRGKKKKLPPQFGTKTTPTSTSKKGFETLFDDAVLGVKKK